MPDENITQVTEEESKRTPLEAKMGKKSLERQSESLMQTAEEDDRKTGAQNEHPLQERIAAESKCLQVFVEYHAITQHTGARNAIDLLTASLVHDTEH